MKLTPEHTGSKFGKWTQVGATFTLRGLRHAAMRCECGEVRVLYRPNVVRGLSTGCQSCGVKTHGMYYSPEYRVWRAMVARCSNSKQQAFKRYGGRGIRVCLEWQGDGGFERFFAHAGPRPSSDHQIDRIDNNGNYEPGNVRWATRKENMRNRRCSRILTVGGVSRSVAEWSEVSGLSQNTIRYRLTAGWQDKDAVSKATHERVI